MAVHDDVDSGNRGGQRGRRNMIGTFDDIPHVGNADNDIHLFTVPQYVNRFPRGVNFVYESEACVGAGDYLSPQGGNAEKAHGKAVVLFNI
jgi:hypothetical protein